VREVADTASPAKVDQATPSPSPALAPKARKGEGEEAEKRPEGVRRSFGGVASSVLPAESRHTPPRLTLDSVAAAQL